MLAGCGGSQPPIGAPGATFTTNKLESRVPRVNTGNEDLIYANGPFDTYILFYKTGTLVNTFNTAGEGGLCSDKHGNVFAPHQDVIYEYAHGGTTPIAALPDQGYRPEGCSTDPTSGNLAVANFRTSSSQSGNIAIYKKSKGQPKFYSDPTIQYYLSCSYDNAGNLFLDGQSASKPFLFAELRQGSSMFTNLTLNEENSNPGAVQWDGHYVAIGANGAKLIYRVAVSGSQATVVSTIHLYGDKPPSYLFWVQGDTLRGGPGFLDTKPAFVM